LLSRIYATISYTNARKQLVRFRRSFYSYSPGNTRPASRLWHAWHRRSGAKRRVELLLVFCSFISRAWELEDACSSPPWSSLAVGCNGHCKGRGGVQEVTGRKVANEISQKREKARWYTKRERRRRPEMKIRWGDASRSSMVTTGSTRLRPLIKGT
jgi:hypothetical protein